MKTYELLESVSVGNGLIPGGAKDWMQKFGATKDDIKKAMLAARQLPSYKELLTYTKENTSPVQERNGTISFASRTRVELDDLPSDPNAYPNAAWRRAHGWNKTYVHFYGQVRTGTNRSEYNSPVKSIPPKIYPGDPVKTITKAYDNGFKVILNRFKHKRTKVPFDIIRDDIRKYLTSHGVSNLYMAQGGMFELLVLPTNVISLHDKLFGYRVGRDEELFTDMTDDPEIQQRMRDRLRRQHSSKVENLGNSNYLIDKAAEALKDYTTYKIKVEEISLEDYLKKETAHHDYKRVNPLIAEKIKMLVIDIDEDPSDPKFDF
jgi:hypothetical protein